MGISSYVIFLSVLFLVFLNMMQIKNHSIVIIRIACFILFFLTGLRYIALFVFNLGINISSLKIFSYFYYGSVIGITIPSAMALWHTIPRFKEKINAQNVLFLLSPYFVFYLCMLYFQPFEIIIKPGIGYGLRLLSPWNIWLGILQSMFILLIIISSILGIKWYRFKFPRSQYLLFLLGYLLILMDGLSMIFNRISTFQPFVLSEAFVLISLLYAFSTKPIKEPKRS